MFSCADAKCAIEPNRIAFEWNLYNKASYPSVSVFGDQPDSYWVGPRKFKRGKGHFLMICLSRRNELKVS